MLVLSICGILLVLSICGILLVLSICGILLVLSICGILLVLSICGILLVLSICGILLVLSICGILLFLPQCGVYYRFYLYVVHSAVSTCMWFILLFLPVCGVTCCFYLMPIYLFANDLRLQMSAPPDKISELLHCIQSCIRDVKACTTANMLRLNDNKTKLMLVTSKRIKHLHSLPQIPFKQSVKNLGLTLDCHFTMNAHV